LAFEHLANDDDTDGLDRHIENQRVLFEHSLGQRGRRPDDPFSPMLLQ
jgi:hypothetical protein